MRHLHILHHDCESHSQLKCLTVIACNDVRFFYIIGRTESSSVDRRNSERFHGFVGDCCDRFGTGASRGDRQRDKNQLRRRSNRNVQVKTNSFIRARL